jgi:hypothetical protein
MSTYVLDLPKKRTVSWQTTTYYWTLTHTRRNVEFGRRTHRSGIAPTENMRHQSRRCALSRSVDGIMYTFGMHRIVTMWYRHFLTDGKGNQMHFLCYVRLKRLLSRDVPVKKHRVHIVCLSLAVQNMPLRKASSTHCRHIFISGIGKWARQAQWIFLQVTISPSKHERFKLKLRRHLSDASASNAMLPTSHLTREFSANELTHITKND